VSTELLIFIAAVVAASLLILGLALFLPGSRRAAETGGDRTDPRALQLVPDRPATPATTSRPAEVERVLSAGPARYERVLRALWWLTIVAVAVGVGGTDTFAANRPYIFGIVAVAAAAAFLLHELIPEGRLGRARFVVEAIVATALVTAVVGLTGYGSSPFFFGYYLVAAAVALSMGGRAAVAYAAVASLAYVGLLALDPAAGAYEYGDLLRFGLNIGSIWLLAYLAAVFGSEERRTRSAVLRMSLTDPLTGLYNRGQLNTMLEQEIQRTRRSDRTFSLLMVDLDGLKGVNDQLGHHRGDQVLRSLGGIIQRSIRTVDTAARYGGDEFLVLLPETDTTGALVVAEKIRAGAEALSVTLGRDDLSASVSIGLVSYPHDGQGMEELLIAADRAMYAAKALGKNQISGSQVRRPVAGALPAAVAIETGAPPMQAPPLQVPRVEAPLAQPAIELPPAQPAPVETSEPTTAAASPVAHEPAPTAASAEPAAAPAAPDATAAAAAPTGQAPPATSPAPPAASSAPPPMAPGADLPQRDANGRPSHAAAEDPEDDLDPVEARRRIAALSYDPDHQVRRAIDAFLSPQPRSEERDS
jgi:diguanylate cyclase (GGDEF)-like protein